MPQNRTRNIFLLTCFILPFLTGITAFASNKGVDPVLNADVSSKGFGIMGDSNSDEYQADDHRGGDYAGTTLGWVEQLVKQRGLNFGPWGTWEEPRRTGYEYNWARSGATAESLIIAGQHTGLARQVAEGKVSYVFLWISNNDFHFTNGTYKEIYDGSLSDELLQKKIESIVSNITLAVDTVLAAGPVDMVMVNMRDIGIAPLVQEQFPDAAGRQRVTSAIQSINQQLDAMAAERHIKIVKADDFTRSLLVRTDKRGHLSMENELINMLSIGNEPHNGRLEDPAGHAGTVVSGLTANFLFVEPFNSQYDTDIAPLTDAEILEDAGITHNTSNAAPNTTSNTAKTSTTTVLSNRNSALLIVFAGGMVLILLIAIGSLKFRRH
jgi:hypothetical protein